jgi:hypothetical protein
MSAAGSIILRMKLRPLVLAMVSDNSATWLNVICEGLVWRVLICDDATEARHTYQTQFLSSQPLIHVDGRQPRTR